MNRELQQAIKGGLHAEADLTHLLSLFGDEMRERRLIAADLDGLEAVRFYLIKKHHWLPRDVLTMDPAHLRFALSEELAGWTAPRERPE